MDGKAGDGEDIPREEEAKAGMAAIAFPENLFFLIERDPDPVVRDGDDKRAVAPGTPDRDLRDFFPVALGILKEVGKDFTYHRVGKDLCIAAGAGHRDARQFGGGNEVGDPVPGRRLNPELLVGPHEPELVLHGPDRSLDFCQEILDNGVGSFGEGEPEVTLHHGQLVRDIVPGDAGEEMEFFRGLPDRILHAFLLRDVAGNPEHPADRFAIVDHGHEADIEPAFSGREVSDNFHYNGRPALHDFI